MSADNDLAAMVCQFLSRSGEAPSSFGRRVANDSHLVRQLKAGREPRRKTVLRILSALSQPVTVTASSAGLPRRHRSDPQTTHPTQSAVGPQ